ncbi:MAG: zinc-dependent peptidase [Lautropia sp.]
MSSRNPFAALGRWMRLTTRTGAEVPPLDDHAWREACEHLPFLEALEPACATRVRALAAALIARKTFTGAAGLELEPSMILLIAVQAALPINRLGLQWYADFEEIIVYPSEFLVDREVTDDDGIVHRQREALSGEVLPGGPVVLSWEDVVDPGDGEAAYNVVIHEFAHKLDLADGVADGCPPLARPDLDRWRSALEHAYDAFCETLDEVESSIPPDVDPDSEAADAYWAKLPLDAYAATDPAEFFAVASEAWFVSRPTLEAAFPAFAAQLARLYGEPDARDAAAVG